MEYPSSVKMLICARLGNSWIDLCDVLNIKHHERARFRAGFEADSLWEWLEQRGRLDDLPAALAAAGRADLADELAGINSLERGATPASALDQGAGHATLGSAPPAHGATPEHPFAQGVGTTDSTNSPGSPAQARIVTPMATGRRGQARRMQDDAQGISASPNSDSRTVGRWLSPPGLAARAAHNRETVVRREFTDPTDRMWHADVDHERLGAVRQIGRHRDGQLGKPSTRTLGRLRLSVPLAFGVAVLLGVIAVGLLTGRLTLVAVGVGAAATAGVAALAVLAIRRDRHRLVAALSVLAMLMALGALAIMTDTISAPLFQRRDHVGPGPKLTTTIECPGITACRTIKRELDIAGRLSAPVPPNMTIQLFSQVDSSTSSWWHGPPKLVSNNVEWTGQVVIGPTSENMTTDLRFRICLLLATSEFMKQVKHSYDVNWEDANLRGLSRLPSGYTVVGCTSAVRLRDTASGQPSATGRTSAGSPSAARIATPTTPGPPDLPAQDEFLPNDDFTIPNLQCPSPCRVLSNEGELKSVIWAWASSFGGARNAEMTTSTVTADNGRILVKACTNGGDMIVGFDTRNKSLSRLVSYAQIWVESGEPVRISTNVTGRGGNDDTTRDKGKWLLLQSTVNIPNANQFIIGASGPSCFYIGGAGIHSG